MTKVICEKYKDGNLLYTNEYVVGELNFIYECSPNTAYEAMQSDLRNHKTVRMCFIAKSLNNKKISMEYYKYIGSFPIYNFGPLDERTYLVIGDKIFYYSDVVDNTEKIVALIKQEETLSAIEEL